AHAVARLHVAGIDINPTALPRVFGRRDHAPTPAAQPLRFETRRPPFQSRDRDDASQPPQPPVPATTLLRRVATVAAAHPDATAAADPARSSTATEPTPIAAAAERME